MIPLFFRLRQKPNRRFFEVGEGSYFHRLLVGRLAAGLKHRLIYTASERLQLGP
jgi:hypothetical protein